MNYMMINFERIYKDFKQDDNVTLHKVVNRTQLGQSMGLSEKN